MVVPGLTLVLGRKKKGLKLCMGARKVTGPGGILSVEIVPRLCAFICVLVSCNLRLATDGLFVTSSIDRLSRFDWVMMMR